MNQLDKEAKPIQAVAASPALSIPKVDIAVFCTSDVIAAAAQTAAIDRRMARVTLTVKPGGIREATALYGGVTSPNLIVIENDDSQASLMAALEALAVECVTGTKVIIVGRSNDIDLYKTLLDAGVSDYLLSPLDPMALIAAVQRCFRHTDSEKLGRIIAFVGTKGGTGSSTIAHNVAMAMSNRTGADVLLADLDLQSGTLGLNFDVDAPQGMAEVLASTERLDDVLLRRLAVQYSDHLHLLTAAGDYSKAVKLKESDVDRLLDVARSSSWNVVLDLPYLWTEWTRKILMEADEIVITATSDLASMRNAKHMVSFLKQARPNDPPPRLVLNRIGTPKLREIKSKDFADAVGLDEHVAVPLDVPLFGKAANDGRLIIETAPQSAAGKAMVSLAWRVGGTRERRTKPKSVFRGLLSGFLKGKKPTGDRLSPAQHFNKLKASESGVSAVEFALIAPVFAIGLVATADIGLALHQRMAMDHVLRAGAQAAMSDAGEAKVLAVMESTLAGSGEASNVVLDPVHRYCACPESAGVAPETAPACGTPCSGMASQYVYYRMRAHKDYQPMSLPEALPAFRLSSSMQVQVQ
ncbi:AAA family ATPase [Ciceribacter thiooxidans]|uniref:AAA family ATPase n=1 Tax=Ciceribacter thiooxidans TaxID=1969821 RepID=A0ABV7I0C3_9HYPH|nr:AAA family ATPase [Ciceribacter thiooxidans]